MVYISYYRSPIGVMAMASRDNKLIGLWIKGQKNYLGDLNCSFREDNDLEIFKKTRDWLDRYFKGEKPNINELDLAPEGSEFRKKVWNLLCEIPYGEVTTYGQLAKKMAKILNRDVIFPKAIGGAVSHNPIAIIIPCHRVIGADGSLTGYVAGINKKIKLLKLEKVDTTKFYIPKKVKGL